MAAVLAACVSLAAVSLLLSYEPTYDPWAWLVWGREATHLELDTSGGPSWKPLPVMLSAIFSIAGEAAPSLWLVVTRAAVLLSLVLAYRLGARLGGRGVGVVAALALLTIPDSESSWFRYGAQGLSEPLLVALLMWAVERHLERRRDQALVLGFLAALVRPEVWPFLAGYAAWRWRSEPSRRGLVPVVLGLVPLLWLGGDWWGSGSPFTGGERARVAAGGGAHEVGLALGHAGELVPIPIWIGALGTVALAARRRERAILWLAATSLAWLTLTLAMTFALGYAGSPRFMSPAAAALCLLAAHGFARAASSFRSAAARWAAASLLLAVSLPLLVGRVQALEGQESLAASRAQSQRDLRALARDAGRRKLLSCGTLAVEQSGEALEAGMRLAWELRVPLKRIDIRLDDAGGVAVVRRGAARDHFLSTHRVARPLAQSEAWVAYAVRCPPLPPGREAAPFLATGRIEAQR